MDGISLDSGAVSIRDGANLDAFSRLRTSAPVTLFDSTLQYDENPLIWYSKTASSGTVTHLPNESAAALAVTSTSGSSVIRQTRAYHRYQPGKSQYVTLTFTLGTLAAGFRQRVGYFDDQNGIYLEATSGLRFVRRTYTSGSVVNNAVEQASWNIDKFNGTGPSGITLDPTKAQILLMDLQWLSVGRVRVGFDIDGVIYYAHEFKNANVLTVPYMTTANLPVRYECENTVGAAGSGTLKQICCAVISEGGFESDRGYTFSASNGITTIGVTTRRPILSIRPKATFNSIVNRAQIELIDYSAYAITNAAYMEIVWGGTLTGASFASVNASSTVEQDVAASSISGGLVIQNIYVAAGGSGAGAFSTASSQNFSNRLPLTLDIDGANPTNLTLCATSFSGTSNVSGDFTWIERR